MLRRSLGVIVIGLVITSQSWAFEVGAIIRKIDVDKRIAMVFAKGRERTVKIADDVELRDENGCVRGFATALTLG